MRIFTRHLVTLQNLARSERGITVHVPKQESGISSTGGERYGGMEMQVLRVYQGGALQAPEMPPVPGKGELRETGVVKFSEA